MQACPNSNCQINAISMNRFYGNYVNKCIHFAGIRVYKYVFINNIMWHSFDKHEVKRFMTNCTKFVFFFSTLHFVFGGGNLVRLFDELPKRFFFRANVVGNT